MMNIEVSEYAQLAARVYATTGANVLVEPNGWGIVGTLIKDQSDGFSAGVFQKGANEIVIAYTGTNADKITDTHAANAPAALGFASTQVLKAMKLYIETRKANPSANITFTGHSLGGGLASLMAVYFGKPATTFDAAPFQASAVNAGLLTYYKDELAKFNLSDPDFNLYEANTTLINQTLFSQREASVSSHHLKGEFLNATRASWNTIYGGTQQEISVGDTNLSAFQLHSMVLLSAIRPDFTRAADLGVTSAAIAETLRIATVGDYETALPKLNLSQRQVPIVVKLDTDARKDLEQLGRLMVPGVKGPVMLSQVASFEMSGGPSQISRLNRVRNVNFEVELSGVPLGEVTEAVAKLPSIKNLPAGVQQVEIGDAEVQGEMVSGFMLAMGTGVLCIYIVLVLLFKDFMHPFSVIPAVILSFGGAFVALLVSGKMLSMPSFIGLVMLIGVSTKNSILLVEYAIMAQREHGLSRFDALLDACHKRARPIIMTTIAMVAGMVPLVVGLGGADNSFRAPMAAAVIGGLITSTVLSLLVTPSFFSIVDDIEHFVARSKAWVLGWLPRRQTA